MIVAGGPRLRTEFPVLRTISTRWGDEDAYGHINNVVYYSFVDTAVNGHLMAATGVDTRQLDAIGVVAESGCEFLRQLTFPDDVQVGVAIEKLGTASIVYRLGLFQGVSDEPAALCRYVHVYVDRSTRAVAPIPDIIRTAMARLVRG